MKKVCSIFSVIFLLMLSGCGGLNLSVNGNINSISVRNLSGLDKLYLSVGSDQFYAFDFNVDTKYKWVQLSLEKYQKGNNKPETSGFSAKLDYSKGIIIAAMSDYNESKQQLRLIISSEDGRNTVKTNREYEKVSKDYDKLTGTLGDTLNINTNSDTVLLYTAYKKDHSSMLSLTTEFFKDPVKNADELQEYDMAYLLKCRFFESESEIQK